MEQTDFLKRLDNFEKLLEQLDWFSGLTDIKEVPFGDPVLPKYYGNTSAPILNSRIKDVTIKDLLIDMSNYRVC